ncbi:DUF6807 domain-containing protein [Streptomyces sp. NPDC003393]
MTRLTVAGDEVGRYRLADGGVPRTVPRWALHPLRTLSGTTVTGAHPQDHPWHYGLGLALPDVDGVNLWGGPTYVRDAGYRDGELGMVRERSASRTAAGTLTHELAWCDAAGRELLHEERRLRTGGGSGGRWWLESCSVLSPAGERPVTLGSPGSNGRTGAGYGGFFWRLPDVEPARVRVFTPDAQGEREVNGARADWLAVTVDDGASSWTAVLSGADERTAADPWFVRTGEYAGIGSALAWDRPMRLRPGERCPVTIRLVLADGSANRRDAARLRDAAFREEG